MAINTTRGAAQLEYGSMKFATPKPAVQNDSSKAVKETRRKLMSTAIESPKKREQLNAQSDPNEDQSNDEGGELTSIADEMIAEADSETLTFGELMDSIDSRGFGPLILVPAIISASSVGTIPGMSIVTGSIIFLVAIQMLFRSGQPWVRWIDTLTTERSAFMVTGAMHYVLAVIIIRLAISYYPLALVPAGVLLPGIANSLFAIGITTRDGILVTLGMVATVSTVVTAIMFWPF